MQKNNSFLRNINSMSLILLVVSEIFVLIQNLLILNNNYHFFQGNVIVNDLIIILGIIFLVLFIITEIKLGALDSDSIRNKRFLILGIVPPILNIIITAMASVIGIALDNFASFIGMFFTFGLYQAEFKSIESESHVVENILTSNGSIFIYFSSLVLILVYFYKANFLKKLYCDEAKQIIECDTKDNS